VTPDGPVIAIEFGRTIAGGDGITTVSAAPAAPDIPQNCGVRPARKARGSSRSSDGRVDAWTFRGSHGQLRRAARREEIPPSGGPE